MSWYKRAMPSVKDLSLVIGDISQQIKAIHGVKDVYVWGSYALNIDKPAYIVKDIDIIASTEFDLGDLLAIDNSRQSALRIRHDELENEGFNPKAVAFTKQFIAFEKYNIDHWAATMDGKLLHWGAIPETAEEWEELHTEAEKRAQQEIGLKRSQLLSATDIKRKDWKQVHDQYISNMLGARSVGWCPSNLTITDIGDKAIKLPE